MNENSVPIVDMKGKFATTRNLHMVLANGYIGEIPLMPKLLCAAMLKTWNIHLPVVFSYYYGTPDAELRKRFGYGP